MPSSLKSEKLPRSRPSLADIAEQLGVSIATVSRVLNDKPGISEDVRRKVGEALQMHAYRRRTVQPGNSGAGLNTIAFVVSEHLFENINQGDDFYGRHLFAVQKAIANVGFYPLLLTDSQGKDASGRLRCVTEKRVQGIIAESWDFELLEETANEVPVVMFNRISDKIDSVSTNMRAAAQQQFMHLYELGHRSIACFRTFPKDGGWENVDYWQQYFTFARHNDLNLPSAFWEPVAFRTGEDDEAALEFVKRVAAEGATAIVTYDNYIPALMKALKKLQINAPSEMSLVGFNDFKEAASCGLELTTYRQDFGAIAREAMRLLIDRFENPGSCPRLVQVPGEFIIRGSTAPPPPSRRRKR